MPFLQSNALFLRSNSILLVLKMSRASLVAQWRRIHLPMQDRFNPWSRKNPHVAGQLSPCAATTEPVLLSPRSATRKTTAMRSSCTPAREQPLLTPARESSHNNGAPTVKNEWRNLKKRKWVNVAAWAE